MKKLFYLLLLCPVMAFAQPASEYMIFELNYLTPTGSLATFEKGLGEHNKQYHASGPFGSRVYYIMNGSNAGRYVWAMGPTKWSTYDERPAGDPVHDTDWDTKVQAHLPATGQVLYMRFDNALSRFPADFDLKRILFTHWDIKPMSSKAVKALIEKVKKVYTEKYPNESYGVYWNEFPSSNDGRDLSVGWFFDKYSWLSEDTGFDKKYEEVHGAGSWETFLKDWGENILSEENELWEYRPDLSGLPARIEVAQRQ